jgi:hypothetical protein
MNTDFIRLSLNDLPKYSDWPSRLLGIIDWKAKPKTEDEVIREFETEKWGVLYKQIESSGFKTSLKEIEESIYHSKSHLACLSDGDLFLMSPEQAFEEQIRIYCETIASFLPADSLCELGAGYGQVILKLATDKRLNVQKILAAEYTKSGVKLIKHFANLQASAIDADLCDFTKSDITSLKIPEGSVIYTSYATMYVPELATNFIQKLASFKPSVVIHFEPIFEHCDTSKMLGLLQYKYIQQNDYNRNLLTVIQKAEEKKIVEIVAEKKQIFGSNPLLPFSIIAWRPINI